MNRNREAQKNPLPEIWHADFSHGISDNPELSPAFDAAALITRRFPKFTADRSWWTVAQKYPVRAVGEYLSLIQEPRPSDPIFRQAVPSPEELSEEGGEDAVSESEFSPLPGLLHRYPDRALLIPITECFIRCRHCMRKRLWKDPYGKVRGLNLELLERWRSYLAAHEEIQELILSGGDPLTLSDHNLDFLLALLGSLPHITRFRVHSRAPVVAPSRVTDSLAQLLVRNGVTRLVTQFNHPVEISPAAEAAVQLLLCQGIMVENQAVLLKGVNDHPPILARLFARLKEIRVRPYYLHHPDPVRGAMHFTMSLADGLAIYREACRLAPQIDFPEYVVDLPGRQGKMRVEELVG